MKRRLVELLQCPACHGDLRLHAIEETPEAVSVPVEDPQCQQYCARLNIDVPGHPDAPFGCQGCYSRDVRQGFILCAACKTVFPIIDSVPRLVPQAHEDYREFLVQHRDELARLHGHGDMTQPLAEADEFVFDARTHDSFSLQWERYQYEDKTWFKDDLSLRQRELLRSFNVSADTLRGKLILDAGCGNGRLTATMARYDSEVIGMDLSRSVARANEHRAAIAGNRAPFAHFIQGNIMEPPLRPASFDLLHSSGVLHHTPDTWRAFARLLELGRPGARVYIQLYRRRELWVRIVNGPLRLVTTRMPVRLLYRLCYAMVPVHTALVLMVAWLRGEKSPIREANPRERAVSLFDHLSPRYQYRYTPEQVRERFVRAGLREVADVTLENEARHMVAFVGVKNSEPAPSPGSVVNLVNIR
jgi:SAM-dependent methyltransferase/uncharacterized protein YbaR (Trm112 family)